MSNVFDDIDEGKIKRGEIVPPKQKAEPKKGFGEKFGEFVKDSGSKFYSDIKEGFEDRKLANKQYKRIRNESYQEERLKVAKREGILKARNEGKQVGKFMGGFNLSPALMRARPEPKRQKTNIERLMGL